MFLVISCPRCRLSRVVEGGKKTASCGSCGRSLKVAEQRVWFTGPLLDEAQRMVGMVNARLQRREDEFQRGLVPPPPTPTMHDDPYMAAAAATRAGRGEQDRAERLARALSARLRDFSEDDLTRAAHLAGLSKPEAHLQRMLATHVLFEPKAGRYRAA